MSFEGATTDGLDDGAYLRHVNGKTWLELDPALIAWRVDVLSFLAPHHIADVLPSYLTALVKYGTKTPVPDTLLLVLGGGERRVSALRALLSRAQCAAVNDALAFFASAETGRPREAALAARHRWTGTDEARTR